MAHTHSHSIDYGRAFAVGIALNITFVIVEFIFGTMAHSLALVADAGHNLSDVLALLLAWGAAAMSRRGPTSTRTYGMRKSSILVSLVNAVVLVFAMGAIAWEAVRRFGSPEPVAGKLVVLVAAVGVLINGATALLFMSGRKGDLNIRGAFLHMAADAGVSLGVVLSGWAMTYTGWLWLDPVVSLGIVAVVLIGTWGLLRESMNLALDAVPEGIDLGAIQEYLCSIPGVSEVHDLHVWGMSTTEAALTAHLVVNELSYGDEFLVKVEGELHQRFDIDHATLQTETGRSDLQCRCRLIRT